MVLFAISFVVGFKMHLHFKKLILSYSGGMVAEFDKNDYCYSSWTSGTDYDTNFSIGNHNLFNELCGSEGKYLIFKIKGQQ